MYCDDCICHSVRYLVVYNILLYDFLGMFPYAMLATLPLFCAVDWPRKVIPRLPKFFRVLFSTKTEIQPSSHCLYSKEEVKPEGKNLVQ